VTWILLYLFHGDVVGTFFDSKEKCVAAESNWNSKHGILDPKLPIRYRALCVEVKAISRGESHQWKDEE
jgi:hypothetical protein